MAMHSVWAAGHFLYRNVLELIHMIGAQTSIVQSLTYFEHLSEPMAEFLHILAEQYDYPQLSDEILKYLPLD